MVGVLLSLNRWIRLFANSGVAAIGEHVGARPLMIVAALGSVVSTTCYGLDGGDGAADRRPHPVGHLLRRAQSRLARLCRRRPRQCRQAGRREPRHDRRHPGDAASSAARCWCCRSARATSSWSSARSPLCRWSPRCCCRRCRPSRRTTRASACPCRTGSRSGASCWASRGDGVFLLTLAFLLRDSVTSVAPSWRRLGAVAALPGRGDGGPLGGWMGDRFGARRVAS